MSIFLAVKHMNFTAWKWISRSPFFFSGWFTSAHSRGCKPLTWKMNKASTSIAFTNLSPKHLMWFLFAPSSPCYLHKSLVTSNIEKHRILGDSLTPPPAHKLIDNLSCACFPRIVCVCVVVIYLHSGHGQVQRSIAIAVQRVPPTSRIGMQAGLLGGWHRVTWGTGSKY